MSRVGPPWWIRLTRAEFWPMWAYYIPVWLQHAVLSLRCGTPFFFLRTNPGIRGFILSDSKSETLRAVPVSFKPVGMHIPAGTPLAVVLEGMSSKGLDFPVVLKPDVGYRGKRVMRIGNADELGDKLEEASIDYLMQEFVYGEVELGVFYCRYPGSASGWIPSLTRKEFLRVRGNGRDRLSELVRKDYRARLQEKRIRQEFSETWDQIPSDGECVRLGWVGNHNLGTRFTNAGHLADKRMLGVFDRLSGAMDGFYFGRFDIRAESVEAIRNGNFKVLEVNGVGAEPTHIYDPSMGYLRAVQDLCGVWRVAARIARLNMKRAGKTPTYREARELWDHYSAYRSRLSAP